MLIKEKDKIKAKMTISNIYDIEEIKKPLFDKRSSIEMTMQTILIEGPPKRDKTKGFIVETISIESPRKTERPNIKIDEKKEDLQTLVENERQGNIEEAEVIKGNINKEIIEISQNEIKVNDGDEVVRNIYKEEDNDKLVIEKTIKPIIRNELICAEDNTELSKINEESKAKMPEAEIEIKPNDNEQMGNNIENERINLKIENFIENKKEDNMESNNEDDNDKNEKEDIVEEENKNNEGNNKENNDKENNNENEVIVEGYNEKINENNCDKEINDENIEELNENHNEESNSKINKEEINESAEEIKDTLNKISEQKDENSIPIEDKDIEEAKYVNPEENNNIGKENNINIEKAKEDILEHKDNDFDDANNKNLIELDNENVEQKKDYNIDMEQNVNVEELKYENGIHIQIHQ